jgi:hypothetical protein
MPAGRATAAMSVRRALGSASMGSNSGHRARKLRGVSVRQRSRPFCCGRAHAACKCVSAGTRERGIACSLMPRIRSAA